MDVVLSQSFVCGLTTSVLDPRKLDKRFDLLVERMIQTEVVSIVEAPGVAVRRYGF